ncbi:hypothetical protein D3C73_1098090 [compost metagenome]
MNSFICQCTAARYDTDMSRQMYITWHNADFTFTRGNHARTVRTDQNGLFALHIAFHFHHIQHWNSFRNTNDKLHLRFNSFKNGVRCKGRWYVNDAGGRTRSFFSFLYSIIYRQADRASVLKLYIYCCSAFSRGCATDHLRSVIKCPLGMEQSRFSRNALSNYLCIFINQNAHA